VRFLSLLILGFAMAAATGSYAQEHPYTISLFGSFTTSSKLFHHPDAADELTRSQFMPLGDIFAGGIDARRSIENLRIEVGLSIEYIEKTSVFGLPASASDNIPVRDGFTAVPVELTGYFMIPVGGEEIELYMGGGAGVYFGTRHYQIAGAEAKTVGHRTGYGIHVLSGIRYRMQSRLFLRSEVKFRDVQFETVNQFDQPATSYLGIVVPLDQQPMVSRINIDGLALSLGIVFEL
jgi:hypothetical protein